MISKKYNEDDDNWDSTPKENVNDIHDPAPAPQVSNQIAPKQETPQTKPESVAPSTNEKQLVPEMDNSALQQELNAMVADYKNDRKSDAEIRAIIIEWAKDRNMSVEDINKFSSMRSLQCQ